MKETRTIKYFKLYILNDKVVYIFLLNWKKIYLIFVFFYIKQYYFYFYFSYIFNKNENKVIIVKFDMILLFSFEKNVI